MYKSLQLENILFLDIETVPGFSAYAELPADWKKLWDKKALLIGKEKDDSPESLYNRAGIYAEFGKIICISVGYLKKVEGKEQFRMKSFLVMMKKFYFKTLRNYYRNILRVPNTACAATMARNSIFLGLQEGC